MRFINFIPIAIATILAFPKPILADAPARPPWEYITQSENKNFFAEISPTQGTKVFRKSHGGPKTLLYKIESWHPQTFISNNGEFLISIGTTIIPKSEIRASIIKLWKNGTLKKEFTALDVTNLENMTETTSGLHWGDPIDFSKNDKTFKFQLNDGTIKEINIFDY